MSNALSVYGQFDQMRGAAVALYKSGYFADARSEAQALVKVMAGAELGLAPFASMTGIHIIKGKPVLLSNIIATLIKQHPAYDYRVTRMDDDAVVIQFSENGKAVGESSFSAADARQAGLGGDNWKKYPRNMMFARALSNGARWFVPGVFAGAPVYTEGELDDEPRTASADNDEIDGEIVTHQPQPEPRRQPAPEANGNAQPRLVTYKEIGHRLIDDGYYENHPHVYNAIRMHPEVPDDWSPNTDDDRSKALPYARAKALTDWLIERKAKRTGPRPLADDEPLFDDDGDQLAFPDAGDGNAGAYAE